MALFGLSEFQKNFCMDVHTDYRNEKLILELREATTVLSKWVVDTREKGIREGLVNLGWTPPPADWKPIPPTI